MMKGKYKRESNKLRKEIERKRNQMIEHGLEYGLTDINTLRISQELDGLLNNYNEEKTSF